MRKGLFVLTLVLSLVAVAPALAAPAAQDVPVVELSGTALGAFVALLLSLALALVPGLTQRWEAFGYKRELLLVFGFVLAWALIGLHYLGAVTIAGIGAWGWPVVWKALEAWFAFSGVGQIAYTAERWAVTK